MTPLKPTGPQSFCGKSHMLLDIGLTANQGKASAANETVQAAYLANAA